VIKLRSSKSKGDYDGLQEVLVIWEISLSELQWEIRVISHFKSDFGPRPQGPMGRQALTLLLKG